VEFKAGILGDKSLNLDNTFDVVYCRFVLHAMTQAEEEKMLFEAHDRLRPGGCLYLECRSINDPLARLGEVISPTERIHGHYRRFIILDELRQRLEKAGLNVDHAIESTGLAPYRDEDPVVIRIRASK
jgi:predicted SAM-dependent methyltransferase